MVFVLGCITSYMYMRETSLSPGQDSDLGRAGFAPLRDIENL